MKLKVGFFQIGSSADTTEGDAAARLTAIEAAVRAAFDLRCIFPFAFNASPKSVAPLAARPLTGPCPQGGAVRISTRCNLLAIDTYWTLGRGKKTIYFGKMLRLFRRRGTKPTFDTPVSPETPFMAIGDIHGCDRLLAKLLKKIESVPNTGHLVFVGDYGDIAGFRPWIRPNRRLSA